MKKILTLYLLIIILGYQWVREPWFMDAIRPVFFATLAFYIYKKSDNYHGRFKNVRNNSKLMIIMAIIYILSYSVFGLIIGFSYSIYSHKFFMILQNIYQVTFIAALIEYLRSYTINQNTKSKLNIIVTTIIFILLEVNFGVLFAKFADGKDTFEYISSIILPQIFANILYSYAALKGGYKLTIPYRVIISLFTLLTPIVPAFDWFLTGMFGSLFPVITLIVLQKYSRKATAIRREDKKTTSVIYALCFGVMVTFVLAVYGLFTYKPIVILSNSMVPVFGRGDVVVYYEPDESEKNNLENNTIVLYTKDNQYVVHRIVRKFKKSGETFYITRGDANNSDDYAPVSTEDIIGVYTTSLKYVGYPSVWLNNIFNQTKAVVETGE